MMDNALLAIRIDRNVCFSSGECVIAVPAVFELDPEGLARIREDARPIGLEQAGLVARNCPSGAISLAVGSGGPDAAGEGP